MRWRDWLKLCGTFCEIMQIEFELKLDGCCLGVVKACFEREIYVGDFRCRIEIILHEMYRKLCQC